MRGSLRTYGIRMALAVVVATAALVAHSQSQSAAPRTQEQAKALFDAHKGDFDYLLGEWEFTAENRDYGKMRGFWSAVRLEGGQILDEYRIVGDKGETYYLTSTLRGYNSALDRWELVSTGGGAGLQDVGTGQKVGPEVHIEQRFGVTSDKPALWKIRYFNINPDRFSWVADHSLDNGKTWDQKYQQIEARRIGPARAPAPLTRSSSR